MPYICCILYTCIHPRLSKLTGEKIQNTTTPLDFSHQIKVYMYVRDSMFYTRELTPSNDTNSSLAQGRIYVANEYPTFVRTILIVCQKIGFCLKITLNRRENLSIWKENIQILE